MKMVGTFEGKTHFSRLVEEAERGETIVITRNGKPVALLSPIPQAADGTTPEEALERLFTLGLSLDTDMRSLIEEGRRG